MSSANFDPVAAEWRWILNNLHRFPQAADHLIRCITDDSRGGLSFFYSSMRRHMANEGVCFTCQSKGQGSPPAPSSKTDICKSPTPPLGAALPPAASGTPPSVSPPCNEDKTSSGPLSSSPVDAHAITSLYSKSGSKIRRNYALAPDVLLKIRASAEGENASETEIIENLVRRSL